MRALTRFIFSLTLLAAVAAPAAPVYRESTGYLPELETAETLRTLDRSFRKTIPLVETFERASRRLDQLLSEYRADPTIEREGRLERELSTYVSRIVELIIDKKLLFAGSRRPPQLRGRTGLLRSVSLKPAAKASDEPKRKNLGAC